MDVFTWSGGKHYCLDSRFFRPVFPGDAVGFAIDIEGRVLLYLSILPFICSFVMTYAFCKLWPRKIGSPEEAGDEFRARYFEHAHKDNSRFIFMLSAMAGAANAIILIFAIIGYVSKELY